jgi:hypothetical protein
MAATALSVREHRSCRVVFEAAHRQGRPYGDALKLVGVSEANFHTRISKYLEDNDDAPLAPFAVSVRSDVLVGYAHLETELDEMRKILDGVNVTEPTFSTTMPQQVKARIKKLQAFRVTTEEDKYPQLRDASLGKWRARAGALFVGAKDIAPRDIPPAVDGGFKVNHGFNSKKGPVKTYQAATQLTLDNIVKDLQDQYKEPTAEAKEKKRRAAAQAFFETLVDVVEAQEAKAICAMPSDEPALTKALRERFGPRAEAAAQRQSDANSKGSTAMHRKYKEQGVENPGLKAAMKERKKCKFGRLQTPTGVERAPNNMYPAYVAERIKAGFLKSKNLARAWTNHKPRRKRANT